MDRSEGKATDERFYEAGFYRVRGDVLRAAGDHVAAEHCYLRAIATAARQSAKALELRAAMSVARLWRDQGKSEASRALLAPVYGRFSEGLDTPLLKEAKSLLEELS
jgi:predicted ATPase